MTIPDDCSSGEPRSGVTHAMYWGRTPGAIPLGSRKILGILEGEPMCYLNQQVTCILEIYIYKLATDTLYTRSLLQVE